VSQRARPFGISAGAALFVVHAYACSDFDDAPVAPDGGNDAGADVDVTADANVDASSVVDATAEAADGGALTLLAFYDFETEDATSAIVTDRSGNGHDGLLEATKPDAGAPGRGPGRHGRYGVEFTDRGGRFRCPPTTFRASGALSLWFRVREPASTQQSASIFDNSSVAREHLYLRRPNGDQVPTELELGFQPRDAGATTVPFVVGYDAWTHVVVSWGDGQAPLLFVTGDAAPRPVAMSAAWQPSEQLCSSGAEWIGALDDVKIFGRRLSADEIRAIE
jgi:hypothetical protein